MAPGCVPENGASCSASTSADSAFCDEMTCSSSRVSLSVSTSTELSRHTELAPGDDSGVASSKPSIDLARRATVILEAEEDVCSICLDCFTAEDPEMATTCGHGYHLQCIMQWAQRSRECPLCFKALQLKDASMNELLPFGEYAPSSARAPAYGGTVLVGLEGWELERLLQRLALVQHGSAGMQCSGGRRHSARRRHLVNLASEQGRGRDGASPQPSRVLSVMHEKQPPQVEASSRRRVEGEPQGASGAAAAAGEDAQPGAGSTWTLPAIRTSGLSDQNHFLVPADGLRTPSCTESAHSYRTPRSELTPRADEAPRTPGKASLFARCKESLVRTTSGLRRALCRPAGEDATPGGGGGGGH